MAELRGITPRQDQRLGQVVRQVEGDVDQDTKPQEGNSWMPIVARVVIGAEVWDGGRGRCNPLKGTGVAGQEMVRTATDAQKDTAADAVNNAFTFLTRDTTITYDFVNSTGGIVTEKDTLVLFRCFVAGSGSADLPGGCWIATNGVNHLHFGIADGTIKASATGLVQPFTEPAPNIAARNRVALASSHGDEDITTGKQVMWIRRASDRVVIAAECEAGQPTVFGESSVAIPAYTNPGPADGATVVSVDTVLSWSGGAGTDDVYFGVPGSLVQIAQGLTIDTHSFVASLAENTWYEWLVRSLDANTGGVRLSPRWTFATGPKTPITTRMTVSTSLVSSVIGGAVRFVTTGSATATLVDGLAGGVVTMTTNDGLTPSLGNTWNVKVTMQSALSVV